MRLDEIEWYLFKFYPDLMLTVKMGDKELAIHPLKHYNKNIHQTLSFVLGNQAYAMVEQQVFKERMEQSDLVKAYASKELTAEHSVFYYSDVRQVKIGGKTFEYKEKEMLELDLSVAKSLIGTWLNRYNY